ncbi:MAG TPA: VTT domain-containing protein [Acidobacteriaceae bacterium]|nr:VTT domain-containing protein [Acidobacteriaceae bacterium]
MKHVLAFYKKYSGLLLKLLAPLGLWGIFLLSALDSSSIPVPIDAFVAFYAWRDSHHFYLPVIMAALGSAFGGLIPYFIGRAGGEIFLLKRIDRARYEALLHKFERQEFLALMVPSMLPPPTPWKLFVFGAGVFEVGTVNYLLAVFTGRIIRFGVEGLLVIRYGPQIIHELSVLAHRHLVLLIVGLVIIFALLGYYVIRKTKAKKYDMPD